MSSSTAFLPRFFPLTLLAWAGCTPDPKPDSATDEPCELSAPCPDGVLIVAESERLLPEPVAVPDGTVSIAVGDLAGSGTRQVYIGTDTTLTRLDGEGWATATHIWTSHSGAIHPLVADLTGDGIPDLAIGIPGSDDGDGQVVVFPGPVTEAVDWDSPHVEVKGPEKTHAGQRVSAADLNGDGVDDLITTGSDTAWIKPGPVTADGLFGADGDSVWVSTPGANLAYGFGSGDLSGDGRDDLVMGVWLDADSCVDDHFGPGGEPRIEPGPLGPGSRTVDEASIPLPSTDQVRHLLYPELPVWSSDADADGQPDLFSFGIDISTPGLVWLAVSLYAGPLTSGVEPERRIPVTGYPVGGGDFTGNGILDLLQFGYAPVVLATNPETELDSVAQVLPGPLDAMASAYPEDCTFRVAETWTPSASLGWPKAAWVGDLDGDETADAVLVFEGDDMRWAQVVVGSR